MSRFGTFVRNARRFVGNSQGNVTQIFTLTLLPLIGILGLSADYARLRHAEGQFQSALDSTALMLTRHAPKSDAAALEKLAIPYFEALVAQYGLEVTQKLAITRTDTHVSVASGGEMKTVFGPIFGVQAWDYGARAQASYATRQIEVALVLDNTGSMAASNKIGELKKASHTLLTILEGVAMKPGQVKISLVPYTTRVNIGTDARHAPWLTNAPTGTGLSPWYGYHVPGSRLSWTGCVADRDEPYHRNASPARPAVGTSLYPMIQCDGALAKAMPLNADFAALHRRVDDMTANGATNITLGAQMGLETLTANAPFNETGVAANTERFMILLTDGQNTVDRWAGIKESYGSAAAEVRMNKDTQAMCDAITERTVPEASKTLKVKLYTVLVIDGNETLLRNCATSPDMFRKVQKASELEAVFKSIANEIGKVSLTM